MCILFRLSPTWLRFAPVSPNQMWFQLSSELSYCNLVTWVLSGLVVLAVRDTREAFCKNNSAVGKPYVSKPLKASHFSSAVSSV
jgi:hypothetical protein